MGKLPELSIVIPVYNEEDRLSVGLKNILHYLDNQSLTWELILVDDGSTDSTTSIAERLLRGKKNVSLLRSRHLGKGGAIKKGIMKSKGRWVLFLDIDLATPIEEVEKFLKFRQEAEIIIGSRKMKGATIEVHQAKFRELGGKIFTFLTNLLVTRDISDITCGFKLFRGPVAKRLFRLSRLSGWSFDAEILFLAQRAGTKIKEVPVRWRDDPQTRVNLLRDTIESFFGLMQIRFNAARGIYSPTETDR